MQCYQLIYVSFGLLVLSSVLIIVFYDYLKLEIVKYRKHISKEISISEMISSEQMRLELKSIWPKESKETNDRIVKQLYFMTRLNDSGKLKATKVKSIYHVP